MTNRMKRGASALMCGLLFLAPAASAQAANFAPFSAVKDVCPECPKRSSDVITLQNDSVLRVRVVAENSSFYVIERYGEIRALPKGMIMSVEWANGSKQAGLSTQDQIVLNSGLVITGSIVEERETPGYFRIQSSVNNQTIVVFASQAAEVYKAGSKYR